MSDSQMLLTDELSLILNTLDLRRIERDLEQLCSDAFAGRRVGTAGHDLAQAWLIQRMTEIGLATSVFDFVVNPPVLDLYDLPTLTLFDDAGQVQRSLQHRIDFGEHPRSAEQPKAILGQVVRYGDSPFVDSVQGAWVVLEAVPQGQGLSDLVIELQQQGAIGLLVPQHPNQAGYLSKRIMAGQSVVLPVIAVNATLLPTLIGQIVEGNAPVRPLMANAGHVIGIWPGTDASLSHAPLIVGAHFDGVGDDPSGRIPCAGDNAAAVAVVLEIARVLVSSSLKFARPIQFMAFDCEEVHALGSARYAEHLKEQGITPQVINLDGAAGLHETISVEIGAGSEQLVEALDWSGEQLETPLISDSVSSDNRQFARVGFPAGGIGAGTGTPNIHSPDDTLDKVNLQGTQRTARLLLTTILRLNSL